MPKDSLIVGQLVEITGKTAPKGCPEEWKNYGAIDDAAKDLSGERGQVLSYDKDTGHALVATFGAEYAAVKLQDVRPLTSEEMAECDLVIGPMSDTNLLGREMTDMLQRKGHALSRFFVSSGDLEGMVSVADRCVEEGMFSRLAAELEPGYLGQDGTGKTMTLDFDSRDLEDFVAQSPLTQVEDVIATVGNIIRPHISSDFGFDIYSKTHTVMVLPFDGDEDNFLAPDCENEDAANFLSTMWRAKLMVVANAGPADTVLTLTPKGEGEEETTVTIKPGMLAVFDKDRMRFSMSHDGKSLLLLSWFLDAPHNYELGEFSGDIQALGLGTTGPPQPNKPDQINCCSMGERYAFGVDEPWKVWAAYAKAGWDTMIRHPFMRWDCDMYYHKDADQTSGLSYTQHGGFSDGIELFDCRFFDISPAEAKGMDPTQRQVLEVSYISLQGAGFSKKKLQSSPANVAVFVGLDKNEWNSIPKDISGGFGASSSANAITSNRFNYCMNLKGASMTIDTACSASLVCTHTGKLYLLHKHYDPCEASLICGVNLSLSPGTYIGCCGAGMHSHLGRCFTYNFSADGYARGEATASTCIKLKKWEKESGEYCIVAGSQVNQDGRSASLTAPNGPSQERCNAAVIKECGITPPEIDTTECHGTGTSLGDPIEIGAYRKVMASKPREEPVTITSSKSNIGHCEGSAGVSGFLKVVLLCVHGEGTPNVHLNCLNPHLDMDGFPGIITTEGCTFKGDASYNGVLSFGFGGTNACCTCWGENLTTSRGVKTANLTERMTKKLTNMPKHEVTIVGDDWEDWEMGGPGRDSKPGDVWDIEFEDDGTATWNKREKDVKDLGMNYALTGTFNTWEFDTMESDEVLEGLFKGSIVLGPTGEEQFQIVADQEPTMTFHPETEKCQQKSAEVLGPESTRKQLNWSITGEEGDEYTVEFYRSEMDRVSVTWRKTASHGKREGLGDVE